MAILKINDTTFFNSGFRILIVNNVIDSQYPEYSTTAEYSDGNKLELDGIFYITRKATGNITAVSPETQVCTELITDDCFEEQYAYEIWIFDNHGYTVYDTLFIERTDAETEITGTINTTLYA